MTSLPGTTILASDNHAPPSGEGGVIFRPHPHRARTRARTHPRQGFFSSGRPLPAPTRWRWPIPRVHFHCHSHRSLGNGHGLCLCLGHAHADCHWCVVRGSGPDLIIDVRQAGGPGAVSSHRCLPTSLALVSVDAPPSWAISPLGTVRSGPAVGKSDSGSLVPWLPREACQAPRESMRHDMARLAHIAVRLPRR